MQEKPIDLISGDNSMFAPKVVNEKLAQMITAFKLPQWILNDGKRMCPECGKPLTETSVREVGLCLNAQNIGDIQIEILCKECYSGYYLLFRKACNDFDRFSFLLSPSTIGPIYLDEPIHGNKLRSYDNNLTDAIVREKIEKEKNNGHNKKS